MSHHHLSLYEREQLAIWRARGESFRSIGRRLNRAHTTLSREWSERAKYGTKYEPCKAHEKAKKIESKQRRKAPLKTPLVFLYVRQKLRDKHWSPEIIAGRLAIDHPGESIHHETIYRYVHNAHRSGRAKLWRYLRLHHKRRRVRHGRAVKVEPYLRATPLVQRPVEAANRSEIGHWETDNLGGKLGDKTGLSASVDRKSRYAILDKLKNKKSITKIHKVNKRIKALPPKARRSLRLN